jgi:hypothetical protein
LRFKAAGSDNPATNIPQLNKLIAKITNIAYPEAQTSSENEKGKYIPAVGFSTLFSKSAYIRK